MRTAAAVTGAIHRAPYDGLLGGAIGVTTGHGGMLEPPALGPCLAQSQLALLARVKTPPRQWRPLAHPSLEKGIGQPRVPSWLGACVRCRHRLGRLTAMDGGNEGGL